MGAPSKLGGPGSLIPPGSININSNIFASSPDTGLGFFVPVTSLLSLLSSLKPATGYADITELLANTTLPIGYFAFVADASDDAEVGTGWGLYLYQGPDLDDLGNYTLISKEGGFGGDTTDVIKIIDFAYDGSSASLPVDPSIKRGEAVIVGTGDGTGILVPDMLCIARIDNPATNADWLIKA